MISHKIRDFDLVIIGSGPGGEGAAMQGAKQGMKVAVVERFTQVGGNCTHSGTIPSKALRQIAYRLTSMKSDPFLNQRFQYNSVHFSDLLEHANKVINKQVNLRTTHYNRNGVELIYGEAKLEDKNIVFVDKGQAPCERLKAKYIVIATGSRANCPDNIDLQQKNIFDSDSILRLDKDPRTITILGAGVVGCEYTSIFKALGKKVNLINNRNSLLSFLDAEISDALSYHLRDQGVLIRNNEDLQQVEHIDDGILLYLESGKRIKSDILLCAMGRRGNCENLGLADLGIKVNKNGHVQVNEHYQSDVPHIYAVGDLAGFPALASSAYDQGRFAASHMADTSCDTSLVKDIPIGIYTSPEISCIGRSEKELTDAKIPYEVGHSSFRHLARAQITEQTVGMLKILFHVETLEILGVHCFGQNAAEIIHIGQGVMSRQGGGNTLEYFIKTTFNYPTMAEAYRVAALNGINRLY